MDTKKYESTVYEVVALKDLNRGALGVFPQRALYHNQ